MGESAGAGDCIGDGDIVAAAEHQGGIIEDVACRQISRVAPVSDLEGTASDGDPTSEIVVATVGDDEDAGAKLVKGRAARKAADISELVGLGVVADGDTNGRESIRQIDIGCTRRRVVEDHVVAVGVNQAGAEVVFLVAGFGVPIAAEGAVPGKERIGH